MSPRNTLGEQGVFGVPKHYLAKGRQFINNPNDLTTFNSKYMSYNSPHLGKWADHSLDEFIKQEASTQNSYNANYTLTERNI